MTTRAPEVVAVNDDTPMRSLTIRDIVVGDAVEQNFSFPPETPAIFGKIANDRAPLHEDEAFASARGFNGPILQGLCVSTRFSRLIGMYLPGEHAILERIDLKFHRPTYVGQSLTFKAQVERVLASVRVVRLLLSVSSAGGVHVAGGAQCLVR